MTIIEIRFPELNGVLLTDINNTTAGSAQQDQTARMYLIDCFNGVLRGFQHFFSNITATAHIIHVFSGFHQH